MRSKTRACARRRASRPSRSKTRSRRRPVRTRSKQRCKQRRRARPSRTRSKCSRSKRKSKPRPRKTRCQRVQPAPPITVMVCCPGAKRAGPPEQPVEFFAEQQKVSAATPPRAFAVNQTPFLPPAILERPHELQAEKPAFPSTPSPRVPPLDLSRAAEALKNTAREIAEQPSSGEEQQKIADDIRRASTLLERSAQALAPASPELDEELLKRWVNLMVGVYNERKKMSPF